MIHLVCNRACYGSEEANHHPRAVVDGDDSDSILRINASAGERLTFDAGKSSDPDGDDLAFRWWVYREPGTYAGQVRIDPANQSR